MYCQHVERAFPLGPTVGENHYRSSNPRNSRMVHKSKSTLTHSLKRLLRLSKSSDNEDKRDARQRRLSKTVYSYEGPDINSGFEFSVLEYNHNELVIAAVDMLEQALSSSVVSISRQESDIENIRKSLFDLVETVEKKYTNSCYHNFYHAVDRMQLLYAIIAKYDLTGRMKSQTPFLLLFLSLCLDIGHPSGASIESLHEQGLFLKYNCLADFHIQEIETIVSSHAFFSNYTCEQLRTELIHLCRDLLNPGKEPQYLTEGSKIPNEVVNSDHLKILLRIADSANIVRPFTDAQIWSAAMTTEKHAVKLVRTNNKLTADTVEEFNNQLQLAQRNTRKILTFDMAVDLGHLSLDFVQEELKPLISQLRKLDKRFAKEYEHKMKVNTFQLLQNSKFHLQSDAAGLLSCSA